MILFLPTAFRLGRNHADCKFMGATIGLVAMAAPHPVLNILPGKNRGWVLEQVSLSPGEIILVPAVDWHFVGRGRQVIPEILDEPEFLRRAQVEDRALIRVHD